MPMHRELQPGLLQIHGTLVTFYLLFDNTGAVLIDTGFIGDFSRIESALLSAGLSWSDVRAILLTHGHLDHTFNLARLRRHCADGIIYGHPLDLDHFRGMHRYKRISRVCGLLEASGRRLFGFEPTEPDHFFADDDLLPFWGGLRVIHLPGHTAGHCGFYHAGRDLLFSGDLFANWRLRTILPWSILNSCPEKFPGSLAKVRILNPGGILSNHCDRADALTQRRRFFRRFGKHP